MYETEENTTTVSQTKDKPNCPEAPKPQDYQEPCYPSDTIYDKIPKGEKDAIEAKYKTALWTADQAYAKSKIDAQTGKATAQAAFDVAIEKANSAVEILEQKVTIAKEILVLDYNKCLQDALPKNCKDIETDVPDDKKAICIAQLIQSMSKEDFEYQKEIQMIWQEKADAERAWAKAREQYDSAICIADAVKKEAYDAAQVDRRKELSAALEAVCQL